MQERKSAGYSELQPTYASSVMHVFIAGTKIKFTNIISYDYIDLLGNEAYKSYFEYVAEDTRYSEEIDIYWANLQYFLDHEINKINGKGVNLDIVNCSLDFRERFHPYVQWIIKFEGDVCEGENIYENEIEAETLDYPISSVYILEPPLTISSVDSRLDYDFKAETGIIEYYGEKGRKVGPYEAIKFTLGKIWVRH